MRLALLVTLLMIGYALVYYIGRDVGIRKAETRIEKRRERMVFSAQYGKPIHHDSGHGEQFKYIPVYSEDAITQMFPILPDVAETREHDFSSILNDSRKESLRRASR